MLVICCLVGRSFLCAACRCVRCCDLAAVAVGGVSGCLQRARSIIVPLVDHRFQLEGIRGGVACARDLHFFALRESVTVKVRCAVKRALVRCFVFLWGVRGAIPASSLSHGQASQEGVVCGN